MVSRKSTSTKVKRRQKKSLANANRGIREVDPQSVRSGQLPVKKTLIGKKMKGKLGKRSVRGTSSMNTDPAASSSAPVVPERTFVIKSSVGAPFLVLSDQQLVQSLPAPTASEWDKVLGLGSDLIQQWEASRAMLVADFEGEFTGFEGELVTAAFRQTFTLDKSGLRPLSGSKSEQSSAGVLADMRCPGAAALVKRVMESPAITKIIWGADGDLTALSYTPASQPFGIFAANVVDAQLGFSTDKKRLGMAKMLERVPEAEVSRMSKRDAINFEASHSRHCRALAFPLSSNNALYAMDDLHRLDLILRTQRPPSGSYTEARNQTEAFVCRLRQTPKEVSFERVKQLEVAFQRKTGVQKLVHAVRIKRHVLALRILGLDVLLIEGGVNFVQQVDQVLAEGGVAVPDNLVFPS